MCAHGGFPRKKAAARSCGGLAGAVVQAPVSQTELSQSSVLFPVEGVSGSGGVGGVSGTVVVPVFPPVFPPLPEPPYPSLGSMTGSSGSTVGSVGMSGTVSPPSPPGRGRKEPSVWIVQGGFWTVPSSSTVSKALAR